MNRTTNNHEDPRLAEILEIIARFIAGDLKARGSLAGDDSALDGIMTGINNLGEELEAKVADNERTMQALSESEAQFGSLFDAILDGICMVDVQTRRFLMANDAICCMLGYSRGEFFNLKVDDIHPREDLPNVARQFDRQLKGEINLARLPVKRKDGTVFQADITATPVTVDGQLCITGVIRDVTERIQADDEIQELNRTLRAKVQQLVETQDELVRKEISLQLAEALRKANDDLSLFRRLLDNSSDAIEVIDPVTLRFLDVNETACRELGYSREEFLTMRVHDIDPDMDKDTLSRVNGQFEESGSARFETTHRRKDGSTFPVEANMGTVTLEKTYRLAIVRDITERKQAIRALEESEYRFRAILDATMDGILVVDAQSQAVVMANRAICNMLGYEMEEFMRLSVAELTPAAALPEVQRQFERQAKGEIYVAPELPVQRKDGSVFFADVSGGPPMLLGGRSVMVGVVHDITERKQGEEKIRKLNDELEEKVRVRTQQLLDTQEKLEVYVGEIKQVNDALNQTLEYANTLIRSSPDGVLAVDLDLRITEWNLLMEQMCGKSRKQAIGQDLAELPFMKATGEGARIREGLEGQNIGPREVAYRLPGTDKESFFESIMAPLRGPAGQIVGAVLRVRDITERKRSEQALAESEVLLRSVFDAVQDGIVVAEVQTQQHRMVNTAMCRMLGYSREELLTMRVQDVHLKKDLPRIAREFERKARGDSGLAPALPVKRKDGSIFYADINAGPMTINGAASIVGIFRDITERRLAEKNILKLNQALEEKVQQLLKSQEELEQHRACLEQEVAQRTASLTEAQRIAHLGNWEWDVINDTTNWSNEMYRIFGYAPQQIAASYEAFLNAMHPEDRQLVDDSVHDTLDRQHTYNIEHRILQPDGTLRYVHGQAEVMQGLDGQPISMLGTYHDITERKLAEERIRESEARFKQVAESAGEWIWEVDTDGLFMYCSPAVEKILGYRPDEIVSRMHFYDLFWPEEREELKNAGLELLARKELFRGFVHPNLHKNGTRVILETSGGLSLDQQGRFVGGCGTSMDITERMKADERLRESEARYRSIFEYADDIIFLVNPDGTFRSINPSFERISGWTAEEWIGRPFAPTIHPDDLSSLEGILEKTIAGESSSSYSLRLARKSGEYYDADICVAPIYTNGETGIVGIIRDVSERKRAEGEIRKLNEELEARVQERTKQLDDAQEELVRKEKLAILGRISGSIGHELRNPLGVMNNAIYFLNMVLTDADATTQEYLGIIKKEIDNSLRIITDLLDFARTRPPQVETVNARALIDESLGKCTLPENIALQNAVPPTLPPLKVDPAQMGQVLQNLFTNAIQAMPAGGALTIRGEQDSEGTVRLEVVDTGAGISPEDMKKLFQPLFTTKAKGIGLGLVVCRNLTEANDGRIEVASEPGQGTTFAVILPIERRTA